LTLLQAVTPQPLHIYATGRFAHVYSPTTGEYDTVLAQQLVASDAFTTKVAVDNGPFVEDIAGSFGPDGRIVLVRNPHFFSNFFHAPALDQVTFVDLFNPTLGLQGNIHEQNVQKVISLYRSGQLTLAENLDPTDFGRLTGIPKGEIITSPQTVFDVNAFDRTSAAANAHANGGTSIFADLTVRRAFLEAYDRCAAAKAVLGIGNCTDPNLFSAELMVRPTLYFDPSVTLPGYSPADAARLMDQAGYQVVDGVRRFKDGKTPLHLVISTTLPGDAGYTISQRMVQQFAKNLQVDVTVVPGGAAAQPPPPTDIVVATGFNSINPIGITGIGPLQGDPKAEALDQEGAQTTDLQQRAQVYRQLLRYLAQQLFVVPVFVDADVTLTKPTLCNFKHWPEPGWDTWNMADWYVVPKGTACP
jgi:ABC-type transport system substrate-binding protein